MTSKEAIVEVGEKEWRAGLRCEELELLEITGCPLKGLNKFKI